MLTKLNDALTEVAESENIADLEARLLTGAVNIAACQIGSVLRLDSETGGLDVAQCQPPVESNAELSMEAGLTG
ncbi:MAG TPA: hypothetical protein VN203_12485, partial [Candidatus Acidoferrum sp.]|nr:hypothetical protein [Candidatus Acidoferrum sp.]